MHIHLVLSLAILATAVSSGCGGCADTAKPKIVDEEVGGLDDMSGRDARDDDDTSTTLDGSIADATQGDGGIGTGAGALDILLVLDNSGSACDEQTRLREGFRAFLGPLAADAAIDVQIAVTTTQMDPDYPLEPIAVPGHIQSTPQPIPGFDRRCHGAQLRETLAAALACSSANPADYVWTDADIECALYGSPANCSIAGVCGGGEMSCSPEDLFPPADSYAQIPKVLAVERYRSADGKLDFERLDDDFGCMSLVGTRGHGIEQGLAAAVLATSPALVGGSTEAPVNPSAPNHGLLREGANFGLVFITDENDCSHDGTLNVNSACGGDICEFANHPDNLDSPLLPVAGLKAELLANLREAKTAEFGERHVWLGAIVGPWNRFDGAIPTDAQCGSATYEGVQPVCDEPFLAWSGDRYHQFLGEFPATQTFPAGNAAGQLPGLICQPDLEGELRDLATAMADGAL